MPASRPARVGVVAAFEFEARCLPRDAQAAGLARVTAVSGVGHENATKACEALLETGVDALLSWGVAGGLNPALRTATLVLPHSVIDVEGRSAPADADWHARTLTRVLGRLRVSTGTLAESATVLASIAQKRALHEQTGAAAVDMESAAVAAAARRAGVPFLAVRVIIDDAGASLPRAFLGPPSRFVRLAGAYWLARRTLTRAGRLMGPGLCATVAP